MRTVLSLTLIAVLAPVSPGLAQQLGETTAQGPYKLTIIDAAGTSRRADQGRVSSQAVVEVTDENDNPVAGVAITFTLPQAGGGGAVFSDGGTIFTTMTNANGQATGFFSAASDSNFALRVSASTPQGVITEAVPVALGGGAAAGISAGVIVAIIAGAVGAAVACTQVCSGNKDNGSPTPNPNPTPTVPSGTITPGGVVITIQ